MTRIASGDLAIGVCDRCNFKKKYKDLRADGNSPSMRVCKECWDPLDRYRLPPRQPDAITLQYPRPDVPLIAPPVEYVILDGESYATPINPDDP